MSNNLNNEVSSYYQLKNVQLLTSQISSIGDKLETPQITRFNHENNVFGASFREIILETNINNNNNTININSTSNTNLFLSSNEFLQRQLSNSGNDSSVCGSKNAPKKTLLLRTISQTDAAEATLIKQQQQQQQDTLKNFNHILNQDNDLVKKKEKQQQQCKEKEEEEGEEEKGEILLERIHTNGLHVENTSKLLKIKDIKPTSTTANSSTLPLTPPSSQLSPTNKLSLDTQSSVLNKLLIDNDESNSSKSPSTPLDYESQKKKRRSIMQTNEARRQQIRTSNREAARRCRERRRQYIETLEQNIQGLESKQKKLSDENIFLKKEITNLQKQLSLHKDCSIGLATNHQQYVTASTNNSQNYDLNNNNGKLVPVLLFTSKSTMATSNLNDNNHTSSTSAVSHNNA